MEVGLSLGSNLGDRLAALRSALSAIAQIPDTVILGRSRIFETEPVDPPSSGPASPAFLNACLVLDTRLRPEVLFGHLLDIERKMGRVRTIPNAPRHIDIDMIYAGTNPFQSAELSLPHPRWARRRFVVEPLAELRPNLVLPGQNHTVREVLLALPPTPRVSISAAGW